MLNRSGLEASTHLVMVTISPCSGLAPQTRGQQKLTVDAYMPGTHISDWPIDREDGLGTAIRALKLGQEWADGVSEFRIGVHIGPKPPASQCITRAARLSTRSTLARCCSWHARSAQKISTTAPCHCLQRTWRLWRSTTAASWLRRGGARLPVRRTASELCGISWTAVTPLGETIEDISAFPRPDQRRCLDDHARCHLRRVRASSGRTTEFASIPVEIDLLRRSGRLWRTPPRGSSRRANPDSRYLAAPPNA